MSVAQYRVRQFAELAGVTVRTLHHYDRLGLLRPSRGASGYRVYFARDLERLEQIIALRCLGLPLGDIRALLEKNGAGLPGALRIQRRILEEKRRMLDRAVDAIRIAEVELEECRGTEIDALRRIIREMQMQNSTDWMSRYYSAEAQERIRERGRSWTPEMQERCEQEWAALFRDVEASRDEDPGSGIAQALADRWLALVGQFTGGDPRVERGLNALCADKANWPADLERSLRPFSNPAVWEFINKAIAVREAR